MSEEKDKAFRKLAMLAKATQLADDETDELEAMDGDEAAECLAEFKAAAFEALLFNPGSDFQDWKDELVQNYHTELIDAIGDNPWDVEDDLANLWESEYDDPASGMWMDFKDWANVFATEEAREVYYRLVETVEELEKMKKGR